MAKPYEAKTNLTGGITSARRGKVSSTPELTYKQRIDIINSNRPKGRNSANTLTIFKIVSSGDTYYAAQYPGDSRDKLSKVPNEIMKQLPFGAKTKSFDLKKAKMEDMDWVKNVNMTLVNRR